MNKYDPKAVEPKWQKYWEENQTFRVETDPSREKFFGLVEFPYPSGAGLHVGHPRSYTAMDVITRQKRMEGKNVLYPIGFDSFGLPTENFAIKTGRPPAEITDENIANFTRQLKSLGFGFDWSRAVTTSEPEYYKWTQWIFLQLYKHGLAYKTNQPINWCPKDKIGLANEEVVDGCCERCGNPVEKRNKEQWMLAITKYADKLLAGLNEVDYISRAKTQQENWIGRSEGAEINFSIKDSEQKIKVFTTRPDTIFGVTFLAVSAEWAQKWFVDKEASKEITNYIAATLQGRTTAVVREEVEKTGIDSRIVAVNPVSGEEVPVWIVNYVLADVGTGAIMAVPAHDERDWEFAQKFGLPIKEVVAPYFIGTGKDASQEGVETLDRKVVDAIIENQAGEFLLLKETANGIEHYHFVGGGTDGEDDKIALNREIREETGYTDFVINKKVSGDVIFLGFRQTKNKNQKTTGPFYHVKLQSDAQVASEVEDGKHSLVWVKKNKVKDLITWSHHVYGWECFLNQKEIFTAEGQVINSAQFDGLSSTEAREKIIALLEEKKIGNRKVQFKLRDWVFSRQRYWGEPIPLVHCDNCADKKYNVVIIHGFSSVSNHGFKPWLKEELEKQGHMVWSPDLPNTTTPNIDEQAEFIIHNAPFKIDGHTILVGCSLGGVVMYKLLEKLTAPIAKAVFVDPVVKPEYNDREPREAVLDSCDWKFDWEKILEHASERIILADVNYPIIKKEHLEELNKNIQGRLVSRLPNVPHFSSVRGVLSEEPSVLEEVLRSECGQIVELKKASAWDRLVSGTKTAKGFAFGKKQTPVEFEVGGMLTFVHDNEIRSAEVTKVHQFKSLNELAKVTELHGKLFDTNVPLTEAELTKLYSEYNPNYLEYIAETGLIVCEFVLQPIKYKGNSGWIPLPEGELPLTLPEVEKYLPTDTGESPLAAMTDWVKTTCPKCGGEARRETDTMPNWAGSSWYFLRYMDPQNAKNLFTANGFKFRPAIEPTEKDKTYFATFKQVYQDLEKQNIKVWAGNRLLLNGLNRNLWTELRTVCLVAWNDDKAAIANYLVQQGYTLTQSFNQNDLYEKAGVRVEIVPVWKENGEMYSLTYQGAKQPMQARDLPEVLMGHLWGFSFRIISPEYNLAHYEYTEKHESDGQSNQEKIAFLSEWVEKINPNIRYWNQVDWYNGGMEHTVLHLLYSRFWNQFLYDIGVVPTLEPYKKRTSHGMILAKGGEKMSKSKGNVVNPDEMVELYGADALRTYIMFMGPFDQAVEWDTNGLVGVRRFLDKVWNLQEKISDSDETNKKVVTQLHQTIKKVTDDIANMSFNTPVAKLMELANSLSVEEQIAKTDYQILIKLVSVFAPHIGEELWSMFGTGGSVALATWPVYDAELAKDSEVTVAVQVNGKVRTELVVSPDIAEEEIKSLALNNETIQKWLEGKEPKKVIYVKGRLVSIVM